MTTPPVQAGWYPQNDVERWWDGRAWTEHTRPLPQQVELLPAAAPLVLPYQQPAYGVQTPGPVVAHGIYTAATTDQRTNAAEVAVAWVLTILSFGYLLPWAIAASRGKSNSVAIGVLNFFVGWTVIGWIAALVMACGAHQVRSSINAVQMVNMAPQYPPRAPF